MEGMSQEVARRLFTEGAALVLLDVPERTDFGIDYNCWTVGPRFKGVKMIPPGFHFVFYRYTTTGKLETAGIVLLVP